MEEILPLVIDSIADYDSFDREPGEEPAPSLHRAWTCPADSDNPHGAWSHRVDIAGQSDGMLAGLRIAIKNNIAVAGVPLSAGTQFLKSLIPTKDAVAVSRILEEGGRILGTANCEYLASSGGSHTSLPAAVVNPRKPGFSAGGSSSGSAALVASGAVDVALGTDQGGSIRIPASWSGVVGMKPTRGLVPYTGALSIDPAIDHIGPLSRDVYTNARLLSAIAGPPDRECVRDYTLDISSGIAGLRVGIVREGFGTPISEEDVDEAVFGMARSLRALGATVEEVSIPLHDSGRSIWAPIFIESFMDTLFNRDGVPLQDAENIDPAIPRAFRDWRRNTQELPVPVKVLMVAARYIRANYGAYYYARSRRLTENLRQAYDAALSRHDLLVMPTTPFKAKALPQDGADSADQWRAALGMNRNTAPFCATGHPAMSVPCAGRHELPIGSMLIGPAYREDLIYRAAYAYENMT